MPILDAYMEMLPILQARENLRGVAIAAVAAPREKANPQAQRTLQEWQRTASRAGATGGNRIDLANMTRDQQDATLAAMGVEVTRQ